ncbi:hypothetical protein GCM10009827_099660 [Dactylosporangium maewongense]|uniref:Uncharacterized protein n=1 Tax=Dactylosporangium maewongense TaxID=634393 RepID=A0ABN2CSW7_9ACTN
MIGNGSASAVLRGRASLEVGRRAEGQPELQERLFGWVGDADLAASRWFGSVTLAWIAACCLGYSVKDQRGRARLAESLRAWPDSERRLLLGWAKGTRWFDGVG